MRTKLKKTGRTARLTYGEITQMGVIVRVSYGRNRVGIFTEELVGGAMSAGVGLGISCAG